MPKKCVVLLLLCTLLTGLCGCDRAAAYREPEQIVIITALGFDGGEDGYSVTLETIDPASGSESIYEPILLMGTGATVEQALADVSDTLGGTLFYSHCALIVLGQSLTAEQTGRVIDFCKTEPQITLAARLISAENAEVLLGCRGYSSGLLGYDFLLLFQTESGQALPAYGATLYDICAQRLEDAAVFTLPRFAAEDEGNDLPAHTPAGFAVYHRDVYLGAFDPDDYAVYKMLTGIFHTSDVCLDEGGQPVQARVHDSKCRITPVIDGDGRLRLTFDVCLTVDHLYGGDAERFRSAFTDQATRLLEAMQTTVGVDALQIGRLLERRYPALAKQLGDDPNAAFRTAGLVLNTEIKLKE